MAAQPIGTEIEECIRPLALAQESRDSLIGTIGTSFPGQFEDK